MSSQSYANDGFLISLKDKEKFAKMGLEKEHNLFLELMEKTPDFPSNDHKEEIDELLAEGIVPQNENGPDVIEAYLILVDGFFDKFNAYPEFLIMRDEIEGSYSEGEMDIESGEIYWSFSRSDLFVQTPTDTLKALREIGAAPLYCNWTECS